MNFNDYQTKIRETAFHKDAGDNMIFPVLGLVGEAGEVASKIKKLIRDKNIEKPSQVSVEDKNELKKELGDVLWYLSCLASELGITLDEVAESNIEKIMSRKERGVLHGSGDNR